MPTIIDSLLVTLGLDNSAYKKSAKETTRVTEKLKKETKQESKERELAEKKAAKHEDIRAKKLERHGRDTLEMYKKIRRQVMLMGGAFMGGMGAIKFAEYAIGSTAALGRMSDVVGMSAKELSAWSLAAENAGGSGQAMLDNIKKITSDVAAAKAGFMPQSMSMYLGMGGDASKIKNAKSYLESMANLLHKLNQQNPANALMRAGQMGIGYDAFNLLKQGWPALQAKLAHDERLTGVNKGQTREAQRALEVWNGLKASFTQVGRNVFFAIAPWLDKLAAQLQKFALWLNGHGKDVQRVLNQFAKSIMQAATAIGHLTGLINSIANGAHSWSKFWESGGSFWANMFHPHASATLGRTSSAGNTHVANEMHVNQMTVNTQATDAHGFLADIRKSIAGNPLMILSNGW